MSKKDPELTLDEVARAAVEQYKTYVELAGLNDIPGVLAEADQFDDGEIAPLGLTLTNV